MSYRLQHFKAKLSETVVGDDNCSVTTMATDNLVNLFNVKTQSTQFATTGEAAPSRMGAAVHQTQNMDSIESAQVGLPSCLD